MLNINLTVTHKDGSKNDVVCKTSDYVAFEAHFDKPVSILEQGRLTYLLWLAWKASSRVGVTQLVFDEWVDTVDSIESGDDEADIVPLESPAPTGS